ncbi:efflux transporter outer membrane subunit [Sphingobium sp. CAP-1]|uniref:efflux transporter outer membrane subunit n=1 Tax=Sphingobium sp. CAP-1 TaxID=2676077 RepID=UPI0012BB362C|nr:efflux transporter outer membrane subunit [Sphingobium sp. CAP-1]QGP81197.1 efflux transporter outer membrane subunit [Sphingobium sp. CAP-1]
MRAPLLILLPLAACAGPTVDTATVAPVAPPPAWRTDAGPVAPFDRAWWQGFGDPALTMLVERALADNVDIAIAGARVREAQAQQGVARAALLPTLEAVGAAADSRSVNAFGHPIEQTAAQPQLQAAWEADLFGRLSDRASAARSAWLASQAARDAIRLSVAATAASGYIQLRALDARLVVARQTLAAREAALTLAQRRSDAGYSPRLELAQAQAEYEATAQVIPPLELAIARQENALRLLSGDLPGAVTRGAALTALTRPAVADGLPSDLLRRRPDIAQAEYQLAAADKSLAAARKAFLPQLRLTASGGAAFSTLLADPITIWSVGGSVLAPLFEGGRLRAGAEAAGAQRDSAAFAYRKAALGAFREVEDALATMKHGDEQVQLLQRQRDAAAEGLRLATNRYRAGYSPYLEQLDAQRSFFAVELALVQAQADALAARVALYQAMGGGWNMTVP